jgi:hypothetical protein
MQVFSLSLDFPNPELDTPKLIYIFVELSFKSLHNLVRTASLIEEEFDDHSLIVPIGIESLTSFNASSSESSFSRVS